MGSLLFSAHPNRLNVRMEAIKKKVQSMKVEKDNLCDRMDAVEQSLKDAKIRQEKAEEESVELSNKQKHLEIEVDVYGEKLTLQMMDQETMEAKVMAAEAEFNRLNRRVQELEEDLETTENKYVIAMQKYDKAATTADDSDRMAKVLQNRSQEDEKKMSTLAEQLKDAQKQAEDADVKYDDASKKMQTCEAQLESYYKDEIKRLTAKLKQSDTRAEFAERSVQKLQKEVDRLEDELVGEQDKFKAITEELDQTFAEMSGY